MSRDDAKPSQAEGEDPEHPDTGQAPEEMPGHPSQAEGEDG
ncbi:hypothetical protein [Microbacterium oleivorans]|nr:hypothetical protein [Microbacterium oleivorans]